MMEMKPPALPEKRTSFMICDILDSPCKKPKIIDNSYMYFPEKDQEEPPSPTESDVIDAESKPGCNSPPPVLGAEDSPPSSQGTENSEQSSQGALSAYVDKHSTCNAM